MNKLYNDTAVQAIANAIRAKNGSSDTYTIAEMSTALNDLSYYAKPTISNVALATFEADGLPLNSLKVSVEAKQEGSGTPSPENVRPISGWSEVKVSNVGKNLIDTSSAEIGTAWNGASNSARARLVIPCKPNTTYTYSRSGELTVSNIYVNTSDVVPASSVGYEYTNRATQTMTTGATDKYIIIAFSQTAITQQNVDDLQLQLELGSTATAFVPYASNLYTISLPQTVYGGEVDVVNGELKITDGYIASYNGETLPSTWISSEDVYAEGTTPTTGAEVCYELANPIIINLTPTLIKSLNGTNNLSVDCGEVIELEYFKEV